MFHVLASACASCQRGGTAAQRALVRTGCPSSVRALAKTPCKDAEGVPEVRFRLSRGLEANLPEEEIRKPLSHDVTRNDS